MKSYEGKPAAQWEDEEIKEWGEEFGRVYFRLLCKWRKLPCPLLWQVEALFYGFKRDICEKCPKNIWK